MDPETKLVRLERLQELVERYMPLIHAEGLETERLHAEICEIYGEIASVFDEVLGKNSILVPYRGVFHNYFEAGFLSGRAKHLHQGRSELCDVIQKVKGERSSSKSNA